MTYPESEIRAAQEAMANYVKAAKAAVALAQEIAEKYDLYFAFEVVEPTPADDNWCESSPEETDWKSSADRDC